MFVFAKSWQDFGASNLEYTFETTYFIYNTVKIHCVLVHMIAHAKDI